MRDHDGDEEDEDGDHPENIYFRELAVRLIPPGERVSPLRTLQVVDLVEHARRVFAKSAIDPLERLQNTEAAMKRMADEREEKKKRREEEKRRRAAAAEAEEKRDEEEKREEGGEASNGKGGNGGDAEAAKGSGAGAKGEGAKSPRDEDSAAEKAHAAATAALIAVVWTQLQWFDHLEDARQFVLKCQPFEFESMGVNGEAPGPDGQLAEGATPYCEDFYCVSGGSTRKLRIRHFKPAQDTRRSEGKNKRLTERLRKVQQTRKVQKPWLVEQGGALFERLPPRELKDAPGKYYIAVDSETAEKVLSEGYRAVKRTSVPCAGTPAEALAAFNKRTDSQAAGTKPVVLTVKDVPTGCDIVAHRTSGFRIRTNFLPPECFSRKQRVGGPEAVAPQG